MGIKAILRGVGATTNVGKQFECRRRQLVRWWKSVVNGLDASEEHCLYLSLASREGLLQIERSQSAMSQRVFWAVSALILLALPPAIQAGPMSFNFSGTLPSPVYGTSQFTGSLSFDSNPIVSGGVGSEKSAVVTGSDISLMVDVGGHEIKFGSAELSARQESQHGSFWDYVEVDGGLGNDPYLTGIRLGFGPQPDTLFPNVSAGVPIELRAFNFLDGLPGVAVYYNSAASRAPATITSFEPAPIPEPSTILIYAGMGVAAMISRHRRKRLVPA
jgi:hypothetical protein